MKKALRRLISSAMAAMLVAGMCIQASAFTKNLCAV